MSAEKQIQDIDKEIHEYLDGHPLGKDTDEIIRKFNADYSQEKIMDSIERLKTNKWVIDRGNLVWQPRN